MQHPDNSPPVGTKKLVQQDSTLLLVVVIASILVSLTQRLSLDFRAGHMDEYDYLFVGKTLLQGLKWPTHTYIFGADFNWYFFGAAERWLGGLTGARTAAAVLGMISLVGVYQLSTALWNSRRIAITATLLLALNSGHIFTSKLATYDIVSFTLFSLALAPMIHGAGISQSKLTDLSKYLLIIIASLLILFSVLAKYTTIAYLPVIACTLMFFSVRAFLLFVTITALGLAIYVAQHWVNLNILYEIQIKSTHGANTTYSDTIIRSVNHTWVLLVPSLLALLKAKSIAGTAGKRMFFIITGLLLFTLPLFLYHLQGQNLISLYKHLNYANLFLSVSAAWLLVSISRSHTWQNARNFKCRLLCLASFTIFYILFNTYQLRETQRGFPDVANLLKHLEKADVSTSILSEDPYLFRYISFGQLSQEHIKETSWLDNDRNGTHTPQDVQDAIWDRKFAYVLLTDAIHPKDNKVLRSIMRQRGYSLQFNEYYTLSNIMSTNTHGEISLYRRNTQPTQSANNHTM